MKNIILLVLALVLAFVLITLAALESDGVITVITDNQESGEDRQTHIWYVPVESNILFLEAGNPANPWVQDLSSMTTLRIEGEGLDGVYRFQARGKESHDMIRAMMRERYGWRDWWISVVFDTSQSYAIRVEQIQEP